ncbi:hypothetical protein IGI37_002700 [Enterococcus sp. AZ194]|uniref:DUF5107 domain-containing protein n=1 Tax=Enterococcus sp. AZ194 TaxID=2774629 RepID=UPI003F29B149
MNETNVNMWEEKIIIPTYKTAVPDKNPLFFEKRVYQGSSGKVYPLPITEKIMDDKEGVEYNAVFIENAYLKVMILPELGGRIQRAYDKTNQYDFVYYNHVIKPALVGLVGPWISGGIEFNWPQHHRPSTYMPTEYKLVDNEDGSKTVYVSEIDQMYGTKGMAGFTLYPDKAYIEITGKLYNRTDTPQTFLWWANPAVPVNDHTYSVFPPDVHAVMDHGKRAVSSFPIATGTYYKYDYSEGIDISRYKNVEVPTSYMAYHSDYDFIGNYDEQKKAGLLHVADHHISPGKKQWTWGNGDFGQSWDQNLTDEDGPYIELMTGVFTDNQPDFTWLKPYEEKTFTQYFMPYKGVGRVKNATIKAALNIEIEDNQLVLTCYGTQKMADVSIHLSVDDQIIFSEKFQMSPIDFQTFTVTSSIETIDERVKVAVVSKEGEILVAYQGEKQTIPELPDPAESLALPKDLKSTEELYLAATHIEQYRHATLDAEDYYLEGLNRDASDIRLNNGYGVSLYKRGLFKESIEFLKRAVAKQTWKSPNPYYGEPLFNLGLAQLSAGQRSESFDSFYKATWSDDTQAASFYQLACIEAQNGNYNSALAFIEKALVKNAHSMKARGLQLVLSRKLGKKVEALIKRNYAIDYLDLATHFEEFLLTGRKEPWEKVMRGSLNNYLELAVDYIQFGDIDSALQILQAFPNEAPMIHYFIAYLYHRNGENEQARTQVQLAEKVPSDYCFPNKLSEQMVLVKLIELFPEETGFAKYYLGNLFYDKRRYEEAIELWEESVHQIPEFPTVYRNLAFAYFNQRNDLDGALDKMTNAFSKDNKDARLLLEFDLLKAKKGLSIRERRTFLEKHLQTVLVRDDLYVEYITLLNNDGDYQKALSCIQNRQFHPWEGGEGKVSAQYVYSLVQLARQTEDLETANKYLLAALDRPRNLGEGKLANYHDNFVHFYLGQNYEGLGLQTKANEHYQLATKGGNQPESVMYYNDQPADLILYKGLAHQKIGEEKEARTCFHKLLSYGEKHFYDEVAYDYFAVSLPATVVFKEDLSLKNQIYCEYLMGLAYIGLTDYQKATEIFNKILSKNPAYQGALQHLLFIKNEEQ